MSKSVKLGIDVVIMLIIMVVFSLIEPFGSISPLGMKVLGIFIAMLYCWTMQSCIWPSFVGIIALLSIGSTTAAELWAGGMGSTTMALMFMIMAFMALVDSSGVMAFFANWLISRKFLAGRPWLFTLVTLVACYYVSGLASPVVSIFIFWGLIYRVADVLGYKKFDKWPTIMIVGVAMASTLGAGAFPYKALPLMILGTFKSITGTAINFGGYSIGSLILGTLCMIVYCAVARFIYRPDVSLLKNINSDIVSADQLKLDKKQKIVFISLILYVAAVVLPSFLAKIVPQVSEYVAKIDTSGVTIIFIIAMMLIHVDGKPIMNFTESVAKGVLWDTIIITAIVLPVSVIMMRDELGIKQTVVQVLQPILAGHSAVEYVVVVLIISVILTNFANNAVIGIIFTSISCALAGSMGLNLQATVALIVLAAHMALFTPAASPLAAMLHSNEWVKQKDVMIYAGGGIIAALIVFIVVGIPLTNMLF